MQQVQVEYQGQNISKQEHEKKKNVG
jgi:hypothetical protein